MLFIFIFIYYSTYHLLLTKKVDFMAQKSYFHALPTDLTTKVADLLSSSLKDL
jgi:hypothetical protein